MANYRRVAASVFKTRPLVTGKVGASPEIYDIIDPELAEGEVVAFSSTILAYTYKSRPLQTGRFLGVVGHRFRLVEEHLEFEFQFTEPEGARIAFVLGQNDSGIQVESADCWLEDISLYDKGIILVAGAAGKIVLRWPRSLPDPSAAGVMLTPLEDKITDPATKRVLMFAAARSAIDVTFS